MSVAITAGTGTDIATDNVSGVGHIQLVRLAIGTTGSASAIPADATYGMDVDVMRMPASARTTDSVAAGIQTDALLSDTTALTPKFATITSSTSGNLTVVAAVTSKKIRVVSLYMVAGGTVSVSTNSSSVGPAIAGVASLATNTGVVLPFNPVGWFETASGASLNLNLSASQVVGGALTYIEV